MKINMEINSEKLANRSVNIDRNILIKANLSLS